MFQHRVIYVISQLFFSIRLFFCALLHHTIEVSYEQKITKERVHIEQETIFFKKNS